MDWIVAAVIAIASTGIALWMAGAIHYDVCGEAWWGRWVAALWLGAVLAMFALWPPLWQPFALLVGLLVLSLFWWFRQKPSHDREWEASFAVLPRARRDGETFTIENVRNFEYRSLD